eukprot:220508-Prymnesium_polylepis.1
MRALVVVLDGIDEAAGRRETISSFVRDALVPAGLRVVCTSRPEGVEVDDFKSRFVILDLKPLSEAQQQEAINVQLEQNSFGRIFSKHLLSFSAIRSEHDRLYYGEAFPSAEERARVEGFAVPNRQFLDGKGGERDKEMRQKVRSGSWASVSAEPEPASAYLRELCSALTPSALARIDAALKAEPNVSEAELKRQMPDFLGSHLPAHVSVGTRLALLVQKRRNLFEK